MTTYRYILIFSLPSRETQSFTVALAVKANGEKLPPKVIFKGVRQLRINLPPRMQVSHKKRLDGWRRYLSLHLFIFFRFVTYQITEHVLSSTYPIYANLTSLVGEFVYICRRLIISALMFGFNGNSLKYFSLYLSFLGTKEWVQMPKQAL